MFKFNSAKAKAMWVLTCTRSRVGRKWLKTVGVHVIMCTYLWVSDTLDTLGTLPTTGKVFIYQAFSLNLQTDKGKQSMVSKHVIYECWSREHV